ncbi:MAG TPA: hypothetical protein VF915_09005 [Reyranella sp.]
MSGAISQPVRLFVVVALASVPFWASGSGWAQQRGSGPACDRAAAAACTDQKVVECLNQHKGNQAAIGQCQMQQNMACNTKYNCPNSAQ